MNLYLFPEKASENNGYSIAVKSDYDRLLPSQEDTVIWYSDSLKFPLFSDNHILIKRPSLLSSKRIINVLQGQISCEVIGRDLQDIKNDSYDTIFCGDVVFYRVLRKMFPEKRMIVRFHNCFARIKDRNRILRNRLNWKFKMDMEAFYLLESEIFRDPNVEKIFISKEDRDYYQLITGRLNDSSIWAFDPDRIVMERNRKPIIYKKKLVWFGGLEAHKIASMRWFIDSVYPRIRSVIPDVEFHLWGNTTAKMNNPLKGIYGHGFYEGIEMPFKNAALYINPDLVGGGVKIKLKTYFESGIPFITTPFGYEGYSDDLIDDEYCYSIEPDLWAEKIISILDN